MKQMSSKREKHSSPLIKKLMAERDPIQTAKTRNRMLLAAKIADALKAKGLKKKDLAEALSKQPSEITKWLSGTHNFTLDTLTEIGFKLGVDLINLSPPEIKTNYEIIVVQSVELEKQQADLSDSYLVNQFSFSPQPWGQC
jgi:transcriptional regulator with XRE-family HTH domain